MPKRKPLVIPEGTHPIIAWRLTKDFTQGELACLIDCDRATLNKIENRKINPTDEQKVRIRLFTGVNL
ncbi:helix-turn-helix transcriptional regulator [Anaerosinus massiliensis]|uniref:helix-turn-helix transcriptional regulator n=1 Tax=Massilibacillus massiliensis TaxID=1806837 RepID=UPI000DA63B4C|nr:helix-turn-helix transcriptional regulator [Massilibacillus massiliensis]